MTIEKRINEDDLIKAKMKADFLRKYEEAKDKGFKGDLEDFIRKIKYLGLAKGGRIKDPTFNIYRKGGPVKPIQNGQTTLTSDDWDLIINSTDFPYELFDDDWMHNKSEIKIKPKKFAFKYGASSQSEEDLIGREIDNWQNEIIKGDIDPATSFMQYLDMILGRQGVSRGGIVSIVPTL